MWSLFRIPGFAPFWASKALSEVGNGVTMAVWSVLLLHRFGLVGMAWCMAAMALGSTAGSFLGGVLADRWSRPRVMMLGDATAAVMIVAFIAGHTAGVPFALVIGIALTIGVAESVYAPAHRSAISQLVNDPDRLVAANALEGWTGKAGRVLGMAVGGVFAGAGIPLLGLWVDVASYVLSMGLLMLVTLPPIAGGPVEAPHPWREMREGLREVTARPWVCAVMVQGTIQIMLVYGLIGPLLVDVYIERYGDAALSWIRMTEALAGIVGAWAVVHLARRLPPRFTGWAAMLGLVPTLAQCALLASTWPVWAALGAAFAAFFGISIFVTLWFSALQRHIPQEAQGRVFALDNAIQFGGMPAGYALAPFALGVLGATGVAWFTAVALLVTTFGVFAVRGVASFGAVDAGPPEQAPVQ